MKTNLKKMQHPPEKGLLQRFTRTDFVLIFIVIMLLAYIGWIAWQKNNVDRHIRELRDVSLANISGQIAAMADNQKFSRNLELAAQVLGRAEKTHVSWSPKLESVINLSTEGVRFEDISIDPTGAVQIQGKSVSADAIAQQVSSLEQKKLSPFLSSLNFPKKSGELYQFKLNFQLPT